MRLSTVARAARPRPFAASVLFAMSAVSMFVGPGQRGANGVHAQSAVIDVFTVAALQDAIGNLASGTTIRVAPGQYRLTQELRIRNGVRNVAIVGATGRREDVVILGTGMATPGVNIALKVENAQDVRIADLSVGEAYWHPIQLQGEAGADRVHISNVRLFDAGQQFLKSTVNPQAPNGVDDVIVERSLVEYTVIGPTHGYTEGIDVHHGANWIIRHNVFRNIRVPAGAADTMRPAILMWSGSRNTTVYNNLFINCERGIIFGLGPKAPYQFSHSGGAIYNNLIYRTEPLHADAGISLWDSPGTRVYHNTVIQNGTYPAAIEYRFPSTTNVEIVNNLTDGLILQRDGASGLVTNNYTHATADLFVNAAAADLHLVAGATVAVDRGVPIPGLVDDFDGDVRPSGPAPDLGADELAAGTSEPPQPVLLAPEDLETTASGRTVHLSWSDLSTGETEYVVERATSRRDGFQVLARLGPDATSFADLTTSRGGYLYRVRAFSATNGQFSPYSNVASVRVK